MEVNKVYHGDCIDVLKILPENSVDSIVTDPPYHLVSIVKRFGGENSRNTPAMNTKEGGVFARKAKGFMGKEWDGVDENGMGIAMNVDMWAECLRVLKPGGHLLAFSGTRTYHRMASAIEDAGFEVRDQIAWCYGQGFPKSLNISLQIKKKYNIGLCTCNVFEPMIELGYENSNHKRDNISNGDNDGLGSGEQIQDKGDDNNEMAEQVKYTHLSPDNAFRKESGVCELSEKDNKKEQGFEKVSESILQSGVCKSISEDERLGNTTLRSRVEKDKTTSEGEGQSLSDMQNKTTDGIAGSSLNTIQNGWQKLNGELGGSLSQLPQQDREDNRKRVEQIKNDCNAEEWNNLSRFICSKCYCLKKDIGGTALKPSIEPICMARKPIQGTVAENCLKWGTGGINIDESRVGTDTITVNRHSGYNSNSLVESTKGKWRGEQEQVSGRFPANLIHDNSEEVRECFPNESERFFKSIIYQAKASKAERNRGCEELEEKIQNNTSTNARTFNDRCLTCKKKFVGSDNTICHCPPELKITDKTIYTNKNNHPTVKPIALMEYLIKMVTPKGGIVLDQFAGSGSTLVAAKQNGFNYIGIEMTEEYIPIIEARLK